MAHLLWAFGGALAAHLVHTGRWPRMGAESPTNHVETVLSRPPTPPHAAQLTPARAAAHQRLMNECLEPVKLKTAATLFNHEGLTNHARALLGKAQLLHQMMHGAASIVKRCNEGDQHAMAMAKAVGDEARKGSKRAQVSAYLIERYVAEHPRSKAL